MSAPFSIICLSSQEWRAALPTNRQQIMQRAAAGGHRVVFLETGHFLGLHLWRLAVRRGRRSLLRRLTRGESGGPLITVRKSAAVLPYAQRSRRAADVNGALTARLVRRVARRLPQPVVLWIYDPLAAGTVEACSDFVSVYDCVDDYAEQVGGDPRRRRVVSDCDERVARAARLVFTTTRSLYERQRARNRRTCFVRNVGDFAHFSGAAPGDAAPETRLPAPVLGFLGNLISSKVDFDVLRDLAEARPDWSLLLIGPVGTEAEP
ncbi:MAG TPA: hypothetical protein VLN26_05165, partial [Gaiellaceae bacterium]|nr:hypothetical protein [Gaiellaceae bacterium]